MSTDESAARIINKLAAEPNGSDVIAEKVPPGEGPTLLRRWSMPDLLAEPDEFDWLVKGLLAQPTYGQMAGEMKTLKSYLAGFIGVGVASAAPIFDKFTTRKAMPVVVYVGEGGRRLWTRRIRRIAASMGMTPDDLDLHPSFDVAPISSLTFQDSLRHDPDEVQPALVTLDPLYSYHGTATRASDLHQEGALLNLLSAPCVDAGASLVVVNHMNQTGQGMSLKRITMAGSGEWADSWLLLAHREDPDVGEGRFRLLLEVGSRQWGGTTWDLDLDIGRFDQDTGSHDGQITWDLHPSTGSASTAAKKSAKQERAETRIADMFADHPWEYTKTEVKMIVGGSRDVFDRAFDALVKKGAISHDMRGRTESGTTKRRLLWGLAPTPADPVGRGRDGDDA